MRFRRWLIPLVSIILGCAWGVGLALAAGIAPATPLAPAAPAAGEHAAPAAEAPIAEQHEMHASALPPSHATLRSADGRTSFPFRLVNNHVVFTLNLQGKPIDVVLDTGMPMDGLMLYRTAKVEAIGLTYAHDMKARIGGAGSDGRQLEADMALNLTIDAADLHVTEVRAMVTPPLAGMASYHDGVIGATLFKNFVVSIDYDAGSITLFDPKSWTPPQGAVSVPITLNHNVPSIDIAVLTADGRRLPANVVVDLGAGHPIALNLGAVDGLSAPAGAIDAVVGLGVSGRVSGRVGRIAGLEIGGLRLKDVVATFPDAASQHPGGMEERGGNLGDGVLQRFNVAFDYANLRLVLAPNRSFATPFEWDMSGLWIQPDASGALRIDSVIDKSPARAAGLAAGDILTTVNGKAVAVGDLMALRDTLRTPDLTLTLSVLRDGKPVAVTIKTTRLV